MQVKDYVLELQRLLGLSGSALGEALEKASVRLVMAPESSKAVNGVRDAFFSVAVLSEVSISFLPLSRTKYMSYRLALRQNIQNRPKKKRPPHSGRPPCTFWKNNLYRRWLKLRPPVLH